MVYCFVEDRRQEFPHVPVADVYMATPVVLREV